MLGEWLNEKNLQDILPIEHEHQEELIDEDVEQLQLK